MHDCYVEQEFEDSPIELLEVLTDMYEALGELKQWRVVVIKNERKR